MNHELEDRLSFIHRSSFIIHPFSPYPVYPVNSSEFFAFWENTLAAMYFSPPTAHCPNGREF